MTSSGDRSEDRSVRVLYQDDALVAVDKPPGLLVHRAARAPDEDALLQRVRDQIGRYVYPVHRIDRPASGVVLFGLAPEAARRLHEGLAAPDASKEYLVLARGETPLRFESRRPLTLASGARGEAWTELERLAVLPLGPDWRPLSLLRARLHTGRRHQLRRHLHHLAHQVVGDTEYGKGRLNAHLRAAYGLPRLFLHARRIDVAHPAHNSARNPARTGRLVVEAPLAADLRAVLERLGLAGEALQAL